MQVYVSTIPFAEPNSLPLEMLEAQGLEVRVNPRGRKIKKDELIADLGGAECFIAGTEIIDREVMDSAPNLKLIARVGIGLDGVDLWEARRRGIKVTYTPDAPAPAVAELTLGLMLQLARKIGISNQDIRGAEWNRYFGFRLSEMTIGIIGTGRIGGRVLRRLSAFGSPRILVNSLSRDDAVSPNLKLTWVDKDTIFRESDMISLHVPLTPQTRDMITAREFALMKQHAMLVNTARGGIVNEDDLYTALTSNIIASAAVDVFEEEPYLGPLAGLGNCFCTAHLGSMSFDCRSRMEIEACDEVVRHVKGLEPLRSVPESEYHLRES